MPMITPKEALAVARDAVNTTPCLVCRLTLVQHHVAMHSEEPEADLPASLGVLVLASAFVTPVDPGVLLQAVQRACPLHYDGMHEALGDLINVQTHAARIVQRADEPVAPVLPPDPMVSSEPAPEASAAVVPAPASAPEPVTAPAPLVESAPAAEPAPAVASEEPAPAAKEGA
jgi:hypothetical protein